MSGLHTTLDLPDLPCGLDHRQRVGKSELQGHDHLFQESPFQKTRLVLEKDPDSL